MRYTVVIEKGETSYGAYVPDLPGCVAVGETLEDTVGEILLNNFGNVILHENSDYFRSDRIIKS
ncbi:MAG: type II toxin-antitoxin system HicB family antitoxin, partial [Nostoc sp.]|uniref:type II toxin-antitoxin system HicB family antitoxin n=1 Tax=Nostoc sp. TaxID=1180 RepID=UPI002FF7BD61